MYVVQVEQVKAETHGRLVAQSRTIDHNTI